MCAPTCVIRWGPISCPAGMQEAASAASKGAPRAEGFELDLVGSQGAWVAASTLMLGLASGQLVAVSLQVDGGSVKRIKACLCLPCTLAWLPAADLAAFILWSCMRIGPSCSQLVTSGMALQVSKVSAAAPPSCMCAVGAELIFLGSCAGDSLLLRALPEQQAKSEV